MSEPIFRPCCQADPLPGLTPPTCKACCERILASMEKPVMPSARSLMMDVLFGMVVTIIFVILGEMLCLILLGIGHAA